jgi:hypothetical protein
MAYAAPNITTSGATFAQLQAGGLSGVLELLITANIAASAAPTSAATATATGGGSTGGLLAAGTYYFVFTETDGTGETTISPQGSQLTVAATNQPQFTFPSLKTGNSARNLYLGPVNGATGPPYYLYASGITTTTFVASIAAPGGSYGVTQPPAVNTTGLTYTDGNGNVHNKVLELLRLCKDGNPVPAYLYARQVLADWNQGEPQSFAGIIEKFRHAHTAFAMLDKLCSDIGTLIDANPGHLANAATGIGGNQTRRVWP